jgi:hypothetical protein
MCLEVNRVFAEFVRQYCSNTHLRKDAGDSHRCEKEPFTNGIFILHTADASSNIGAQIQQKHD